MYPHPILAEGSSLTRVIHDLELLMSMTASPALVGFVILFRNHFRASGARPAFFLGFISVLLGGFLCGLIYWSDAISDWYTVPNASLLVGLLVCALAWFAGQRR